MEKSELNSKNRTQTILWFISYALIAYIFVTQYIHMEHH